MVPADDEMGAAVVLAADGVPDRLAGPGVSHRGREHGHHRTVLRVVAFEERLVAPHPHIGRNIVALGRPHQGVHEEPIDDLERALL
jgi:hypothetical protein